LIVGSHFHLRRRSKENSIAAGRKTQAVSAKACWTKPSQLLILKAVSASLTNYRFSGHETFVCRYAWLPKATKEIGKRKNLFKDEDKAMVALGVGKNMAHSIRFWAESAQIIEQTAPATYKITAFGRELLGKGGHDRFLEDPRTLWILHWKITTNPKAPIFFWYQLLNFWHRADFTESEIITYFQKSAPHGASLRSKSTLEQGYRVFVNTYVATRGRKGEVLEDNLDSPLVALDLLRRTGERRLADDERHEPIYTMNLDDKPTITPELFAYCLHDFWNNTHPEEKTLPFRALTVGANSPGQVFKLPELAVRRHLDLLNDATRGAYFFGESASIQQVVRKRAVSSTVLLRSVYSTRR
jgi:hypothetical protein